MFSRIFTLFFIIAGLFSCHPREATPEAVDLRCEYLTNPIGIDCSNPRLSWRMRKEGMGSHQSAYRIMAATNNELLNRGNPDLWDTGKVKTNKSVQVEYNGKPLGSGNRVSWKVQIWDENGVASPWSLIANWEMGLLSQRDWQAKWIGAPGSLNSKEWKLPAPFFRKEIKISAKIRKARVYISGLGYYELYINGLKIGDHVLSPNQTNYDRRRVEKWNEQRIGNMATSVLYETFDITPSLHQGANALGVILGNGWYIQADRPDDTMLWYDTPRFIAQFSIEYEDGSHELIKSDESWKTSLSPIVYNGLHTGEIYDARLEQKGWNEKGFDDSEWQDAVCVRPPTGIMKSQVSPPDRVTKTIKPVSVRHLSEGVYRVDLGQMISGWVKIKMEGPRGTRVKLNFIEELGPSYNQTDTYILNGEGSEIWEPRFTWHAFRYVDVTGYPGTLTVDDIEGRVVNTDVPTAGTFECSNQLLNRILQNYQWTQLGNLHGGIPSDCPHRERRGYTGDGQISAKSAIYNFDMSQFYTKWLNDIGDAQNHKTGYVPNTTPYQDGGGGTAWGAAYVIIPWYMYLFYGDSCILAKHYDGMKHWIEYMKNGLSKDGILINQGLGEWVPPDIVGIPPDFVNTCYYFWCCRLMEKISGVLNHHADRVYFSSLAEKAGKDLYRVYFDEKSCDFSIGRQGANVFPLGFGIAEKKDTEKIFRNLVKNITDVNKIHFDTGILGTPLLLEVLSESGRTDLAYTLMNQRDFPGFGYMIEKGATTIWETFQGDVSHSHPMFGSVCQWFYQYLGGINPDPDHPGFKHSIIKPYPVRSLSFVNTSYQSLYGKIKVNWKLEGDDYFLNVSVPENTTATVYVLSGNRASVTESGKSSDQNKHLRFLKNEGFCSIFEVESGDYSFLSKGSGKLLTMPFPEAPVIYPGDTLVAVRDSVLVRIDSNVPEGRIFYTTDNSEPDGNSRLLTGPIYVSKPTVIKAKTIIDSTKTSQTRRVFINFIDPSANGLRYKYYEGIWTKIPDFSVLSVVKTGVIYEFGLDRIFPAKGEFALTFNGMIQINRSGDYEFYIRSNDGTRLFINNKLVVDHDGPHGADSEKSGKISLGVGLHPLRLDYFQAGGGMFLGVKYSGPGLEKQNVPGTVLFQGK